MGDYFKNITDLDPVPFLDEVVIRFGISKCKFGTSKFNLGTAQVHKVNVCFPNLDFQFQG